MEVGVGGGLGCEIGSVGEGELKGFGLWRQGPSAGAADDEAPFLQGDEGFAETGVVDAQFLS